MSQMYYFPERIKRTLEAILEKPLTVIEAASGYGKTTVINECFLKEIAGDYRQLMHTCLGESEAASWKGICRQLECIDAKTGRYLADIGAPSGENLPDIFYQIRNMACEEKTIFCLDNFQLLASEHKERLLEMLAQHPCSNLHIVVLIQPHQHTQTAAISRKYGIGYISSEQLRFRKEDIRDYFLCSDLPLKPELLDRVWQITEGYLAAICLQMESLKQSGQLEDEGEIHALMECVVWRHLGKRQQRCLLILSVVDSFSLKQGNLMTKEWMELSELRDFLRNTDFIGFHDSLGIYYFHHLLLSFLREKFQLLGEEEQKNIWRKTACASRELGDFVEAARFYGKCRDYAALVQLPFDRDDRVALISMEEGRLAAELIQDPYRRYLRQNPEITLSLTLELYMQGNIPLHRQYLTEVKRILGISEMDREEEGKTGGYEQQRQRRLLGEYALMESFFAFNDVEKMCVCHRRAHRRLQGQTRLYSLNANWTFGIPSIVTMFYREAGKLEEEWAAVEKGMPVYYELSGGNGMGASHAMRGEIFLLQGETKQAKEEYKRALYEADQFCQDSICYCAYLGMARLAVYKGNVASYMHMQENMEDKTYHGRETKCVYMTALCRAYLNLLLERYSQIPEWFASKESIRKQSLVFAVPFASIIYGHILLKQLCAQKISLSRFEMEMDQLVQESEYLHMLLPILYYRIYLAIGQSGVGQDLLAQETLQQAIGFAAKDRLWFPFAEHYQQISGLLDGMVLPQELGEGREEITRLGKQFMKGKKVILSALNVTNHVLTSREREIAGLLKQRLSVKEIGERLGISASTVSNIMQSIYSKLDIHSKKELYYREDI